MSAVKGQGIFSLHLAIVTQEYLGEWIPYVNLKVWRWSITDLHPMFRKQK